MNNARHQNLVYTILVHVDDLKAKARHLEVIGDHRYAAQYMHDEATQRIESIFFLAGQFVRAGQLPDADRPAEAGGIMPTMAETSTTARG